MAEGPNGEESTCLLTNAESNPEERVFELTKPPLDYKPPAAELTDFYKMFFVSRNPARPKWVWF